MNQNETMERMDLLGVDYVLRDGVLVLPAQDIEGADLAGAHLRYADLRGVNLKRSDLRGADLFGADLREADLTFADLRKANLCKAKLGGAILHQTDLSTAATAGTYGLPFLQKTRD